MILASHIFIAIATVFASLLSAFSPTKNSITLAKYGTAATVASGIGLALTSNVSLGHLCASGIAVIASCALLISYASKKLQPVRIKNK